MKIHEYANLFPMCSEAELQTLADDIKQNGLRQPIVIDEEEKILDGRNRAAACKIAGVEPTYEPFAGNDEQKVAYVVSVNLHRRHLKTSQRASVAAKLLPIYEAQAAKRMTATLKKGSKTPGRENLPEREAGRARDKAGAALSVSGKAVDMAAKVQAKAIPEIAAAVASGQLAVSAAAIVADMPVKAQREIVASGGIKAVKAAASSERSASSPPKNHCAVAEENCDDHEEDDDDREDASWADRCDLDVHIDLLNDIRERLIEVSPENRVAFWQKIVDEVDPEEIVLW